MTDNERLGAALVALLKPLPPTAEITVARNLDGKWRATLVSIDATFWRKSETCPPTAAGLAEALERLSGKGEK